MNNKGKATTGIGLIYVILLAVFNLLVFTIFNGQPTPVCSGSAMYL